MVNQERLLISVPGSKSIAIRTLIITSFFNQPLTISNLPACNDVVTLIDALKVLGYKFIRNNRLETVVFPCHEFKGNFTVKIKDSAAALRFLAIRLAACPQAQVNIRISDQLAQRPLESLMRLIKLLGGNIDYVNKTIIIKGVDKLVFTSGVLNATASHITSQLLSGILLSSPIIDNSHHILDHFSQEVNNGFTEYRYQPSNSKRGKLIFDSSKSISVSSRYINLTLKIMEDFGLPIHLANKIDHRNQVNSYRYVKRDKYIIEPDFSSACYFWSVGCILNKKVGIITTLNYSCQPDYHFLHILKKMGAIVSIESGAIYVTADYLKPIEVNMVNMPDQVPTLVVLSLFANSNNQTIISNVEHIRYKESNRLENLIIELKKINAEIDYHKSSLYVKSLLNKEVPSVTLNGYDDHRLIMAFSLLRAVYPHVKIMGKEAVNKSCPNYFNLMEVNKLLPKNDHC